ncbi:uncharacterized protein LOC132181823 [Corylus avellana]|uniref:uncharacterized protein LOC132181823 n=1 Tax=Corylus avellana TaxID=13451 RepID=UPI00286BF5A7|nr:uncharacterized protein LOC132181823 [Corylus avellana]
MGVWWDAFAQQEVLGKGILCPLTCLFCVLRFLGSNSIRRNEMDYLGEVATSQRGPRLNHLFFVDNSLLFCKAISHDWKCLAFILECYENVSRQRLNRDKTVVFFSRNTSADAQALILNLTGVPSSQQYDHYLGLPALVGKSHVREFQHITDRARKRILDWKVKFPSQAGKDIKAVLQAIPTYIMSILLLPKKLCNDLIGLMQQFWWGHKNDEKKIH